MSKSILPTAYLPSVEYFAHLLQRKCVIDLGEHFVKRSERNRAEILTPTGRMALTAHVQRGNRPRTPICDIRLDYSKRWQHQHSIALVSAYKSSPFFDHYWDFFAPFYEREWKFLVDYNAELLEMLLRLLNMQEFMPEISHSYIDSQESWFDLRPKQNIGPTFDAEPYIQVFSDRLPFEPNLSIADLLFAEGPAAKELLARCHIRCALQPCDQLL